MPSGTEREKPPQERTPQSTPTRIEHGGTHREGAVQPQLSPLMQEQQGSYEQGLSDERRINRIKAFIRERQQQTKGAFSPEEIILAKLEFDWQTRLFGEEARNAERSEFFPGPESVGCAYL
jgi:hypothetical protein